MLLFSDIHRDKNEQKMFSLPNVAFLDRTITDCMHHSKSHCTHPKEESQESVLDEVSKTFAEKSTQETFSPKQFNAVVDPNEEV